jgi:hypothetical protein
MDFLKDVNHGTVQSLEKIDVDLLLSINDLNFFQSLFYVETHSLFLTKTLYVERPTKNDNLY